jgi:hypothetical protein
VLSYINDDLNRVRTVRGYTSLSYDHDDGIKRFTGDGGGGYEYAYCYW